MAQGLASHYRVPPRSVGRTLNLRSTMEMVAAFTYLVLTVEQSRS